MGEGGREAHSKYGKYAVYPGGQFNTQLIPFVDGGLKLTGKFEPQGLLPMQQPKDMEAVERQLEDTPRDMECYKDSEGHNYDFAYGLDWKGQIKDARTAKYAVPVLKK